MAFTTDNKTSIINSFNLYKAGIDKKSHLAGLSTLPGAEVFKNGSKWIIVLPELHSDDNWANEDNNNQILAENLCTEILSKDVKIGVEEPRPYSNAAIISIAGISEVYDKLTDGTTPTGKKVFELVPSSVCSVIHNLFVRQVEQAEGGTRFPAEGEEHADLKRMTTEVNTAMAKALIVNAEDNKAVVYPVGAYHVQAMGDYKTIGTILVEKGWTKE